MTSMKISTALFLVAALVEQCRAQSCGSACITIAKQAMGTLSQSNPTQYCEEGALLVVVAQKCLAACPASDDGTIANYAATVNAFCLQSSSSCQNIVQTFYNQSSCFDQWCGGVTSCVSNILQQFASRASTINCMQLGWAMNCQKNVLCPYNQDLNIDLISQNPSILFAMAICGFQSTTSYASQVLNVTTQCSSSIASKIQSQCNQAVALAQTQSQTQFCALLNQEVSCIISQSTGCYTALTQYLFYRLDSIAMANQILQCNVQYNEVVILPAPQQVCDYKSVLNACFLQNIQASAQLSLLWVQTIFDRSFPVNALCNQLNNITAQVQNCNLMTTGYCAVPQALLFPAQSSFNSADSFNPLLGVFPANAYGMTSVFNYLQSSGICQGASSKAQFIPAISTTLLGQQPTTAGAAANPPAPTTSAQIIGNRASAPTPSHPGTPPLPTLPPTPSPPSGRK